MAEQFSSTNVPDLNQEPLTHQSSIFSPEAVNTMIGAVNRFSSKADSEIIAESRMLSNQYAASVTIMSRRLMARVSEIDHLNMQISELRQKLANKDSENKMLKQENQELKKFADWYAHDLQPRIEELERERVQIQGQHRQITAEVHRLLEK